MGNIPRTIKIRKDKPFEEQIIPKQTLLHIYFQDRWENNFKWTPCWEEVYMIFSKCMEVEEKNNPESVWDREFKKMIDEIPSLKDFKLPIKIKFSGLKEVSDEDEEQGWKYIVTISILNDEAEVGELGNGEMFSIGDCQIKLSSLQKSIVNTPWRIGISKCCEDIYIPKDYYGDTYQETIGVRFWIWLQEPPMRLSYQTMCREITGAFRSYLRSVILDSKSIQKGIEEFEGEEPEVPF